MCASSRGVRPDRHQHTDTKGENASPRTPLSMGSPVPCIGLCSYLAGSPRCGSRWPLTSSLALSGSVPVEGDGAVPSQEHIVTSAVRVVICVSKELVSERVARPRQCAHRGVAQKHRLRPICQELLEPQHFGQCLGFTDTLNDLLYKPMARV